MFRFIELYGRKYRVYKGWVIKKQRWKFISKSFDKKKNQQFKDLYVKLNTIGYYSSFYSSLKDKNQANCGNFKKNQINEEK